MGLTAMASVQEQVLKPLLMQAAMDAFKSTFYLGSGEQGDVLALKFGQSFADGAAKPICDAIVQIVMQANLTGSLPGTGTCAVGPVATVTPVAPGLVNII